MFSYNKGTFALENTHITKSGGDIQAITAGNGLVFAGCHCLNWVYEDTADTTRRARLDRHLLVAGRQDLLRRRVGPGQRRLRP